MTDQSTNPAKQTSGSAAKTKKGVSSPGKRKGSRSFLNFILFIAIIVVVALFVRAEMERRATQEELTLKAAELEQLRETAERSGQAVADEVLEKLRQHIDLPVDPVPTVATIVDVEQLREANEFYAPAENGDHLIITDRRAILYDSDRDIILDIVPVQINQQQAEAALGEGEEAPEGTDAPAAGTSPAASPSPAAETSPSPATSPAS
ncbi:hypothetical protein CL628_03630 [bacterium]|nr:hypothetical protein [bacterium]|tara:strand:- start:1621 stop:2241 length:621 start_codon:yes stop_codon:yes gene_type:complete